MICLNVKREDMLECLRDYCRKKGYRIVPEFFFDEPEYEEPLLEIVSLLNAAYETADDYNR
jgi:hypothetical protein